MHTKYMKNFAERLLDVTKGCRDDMHEPDEQEVAARVVGTVLDNAFGNGVEEDALVQGHQELVIIIERDLNGGKRRWEKFNLATLIAMARFGAQSLK
jgi:hypothetical protein